MILRSPRGAMMIEAQLNSPRARVQLVHYQFPSPPESTLRVEGKIRLELSLTARHPSARACFSDHWATNRFERIGDMFVLPPDQTLRAKADDSKSLTAIVCELELEPLLQMFDHRPPSLTEQHLLASLDVRHPKVQGLLLQLAQEAKEPGFASEALTEAIVTQIEVELFRHGTKISAQRARRGLSSTQLRLIEERLVEVGPAPCLAELAALCGISVRQLTRGFRESRGCTLGSYVTHSQLQHAKRLLGTDQSVADIATTLGFSSCSNFCVAFRRELGMTPGHFRRISWGRDPANPRAERFSS